MTRVSCQSREFLSCIPRSPALQKNKPFCCCRLQITAPSVRFCRRTNNDKLTLNHLWLSNCIDWSFEFEIFISFHSLRSQLNWLIIDCNFTAAQLANFSFHAIRSGVVSSARSVWTRRKRENWLNELWSNTANRQREWEVGELWIGKFRYRRTASTEVN